MRTWHSGTMRRSIFGPVSRDCPASLVQEHPNVEVVGGPSANFRTIYINNAAAPFNNARRGSFRPTSVMRRPTSRCSAASAAGTVTEGP